MRKIEREKEERTDKESDIKRGKEATDNKIGSIYS